MSQKGINQLLFLKKPKHAACEVGNELLFSAQMGLQSANSD